MYPSPKFIISLTLWPPPYLYLLNSLEKSVVVLLTLILKYFNMFLLRILNKIS